MPETTPAIERVPDDVAATRQRMAWPRVLIICVLAFCLWLLLFAPTLQHNAQTSPVGTRRTVALDILGPIAAVSRGLQLSRIVSETDAATGRDGNQPGHGSTQSVLGAPPRRGKSRPGATVSTRPGGTTTTTVASDLHPTAADHLRVLIVGDSLGLDLGGPLQNDLANTGVVTAALDGHESTGLTRPDYFNWPLELQTDLKADQPQVIVIMIGANDPQDFPGPPDVPFSSPQWNPMYAARVAAFMQVAQSQGATVIWVGMPPMQNPGLSAQMADLNAIVQQQAAAQKPKVNYISTWSLLGNPPGTYTAFITNGAGQVINVRTPDGTHMTPAGGEVVSQTVLNYMRSTLHFDLP